MNLSFYTVDSKYCDFLRQTDPRTPYTMDQNAKRPFLGIVLAVNDLNYYAPLTSPKPKHLQMKNQIDFLKINNGMWGAINFNNMIPVPIERLIAVEMQIKDTDSKEDMDYKNLLANQLSWCDNNQDRILRQAKNLHEIIVQGKARANLSQRCCNFKLLEEKYKEYCIEHGLAQSKESERSPKQNPIEEYMKKSVQPRPKSPERERQQ